MCEDRVNWLRNYLFSKQVSRVIRIRTVQMTCRWHAPMTRTRLIVAVYIRTRLLVVKKVVSRTSAASGTFAEYPNECGALVELKLQERAWKPRYSFLCPPWNHGIKAGISCWVRVVREILTFYMALYLWWLQTAEIVKRPASLIVCSFTCFLDIPESSGVTVPRACILMT